MHQLRRNFREKKKRKEKILPVTTYLKPCIRLPLLCLYIASLLTLSLIFYYPFLLSFPFSAPSSPFPHSLPPFFLSFLFYVRFRPSLSLFSKSLRLRFTSNELGVYLAYLLYLIQHFSGFSRMLDLS